VDEQVSFEDIKQLFRETDRRLAAERAAEEERRAVERADWERRMSLADERMARNDELIGRLGNRLGDFVREMVRPGLVRLLQEAGIDVHAIHRDLSVRRGDEAIQVDLIAVNDTDVVVIEAKSNLGGDDIREHLVRLGKFRRLFPEYKDRTLYGAIAAMVVPDNALLHAEREGLFVIGPKGEDVAILNGPKFSRKTF